MAGENLVDFVLAPFRKWFAFIKTNHVRYYLQLLKINLAAAVMYFIPMTVFLVLLAGSIIALAGTNSLLDFSGMEALLANSAILLAVLAGGLALFIIAEWLSKSVKLSAVVFTDSEFSKQKFSIWGTFQKIRGKVFWYLIADMLIRILLFLPGFLVLVLVLGGGGLLLFPGGQGSGAAILALVLGLLTGYLLLIVYMFIVNLLYSFLAQFWTYGFLLEGKGVIDSLKESLGIVKRRFLETAAFYILLAILSVVFAAPLLLFNFLANFSIRIINLLIQTGQLWAIIVLVIAVLVQVVVAVVLSTLVEWFRLPAHYLYWKRAKQKDIS
ncbi:hypothetical protein GF318_03605 [Candidatus Micrarchaeota archaeon]|nr:hypothetical protein [Candidatus Micrarchaeota archaeon]